MIKKVITLYDSKAEVHLPPHLANTEKQAIRDIQDAILNPKSGLSAHMNDFTLCVIGEYDDYSGVIKALVPKKVIGTLADLDPNKETVDNNLKLTE